jgi:tRNA (guanine-N7-)-methyltransferase
VDPISAAPRAPQHQHRSIRSFVRREGRLTAAQRHALLTLEARFCIGAGDAPIDFVALFGRRAPVHIEIGCGAGQALLALAQAHPENNYLGIEVYRPGVGRILQAAASAGICNIRLLVADAVQALDQRIPANSLDAAHIYFPDPWPKKRHHKRRLLNVAFATRLRPKLKQHGRVYIATDWEDYAFQIEAAMATAGYCNLAGRGHCTPRPTWRPLTRFEQRGLRLGHGVFNFAFVSNSL